MPGRAPEATQWLCGISKSPGHRHLTAMTSLLCSCFKCPWQSTEMKSCCFGGNCNYADLKDLKFVLLCCLSAPSLEINRWGLAYCLLTGTLVCRLGLRHEYRRTTTTPTTRFSTEVVRRTGGHRAVEQQGVRKATQFSKSRLSAICSLKDITGLGDQTIITVFPGFTKKSVTNVIWWNYLLVQIWPKKSI